MESAVVVHPSEGIQARQRADRKAGSRAKGFLVMTSLITTVVNRLTPVYEPMTLMITGLGLLRRD